MRFEELEERIDERRLVVLERQTGAERRRCAAPHGAALHDQRIPQGRGDDLHADPHAGFERRIDFDASAGEAEIDDADLLVTVMRLTTERCRKIDAPPRVGSKVAIL